MNVCMCTNVCILRMYIFINKFDCYGYQAYTKYSTYKVDLDYLLMLYV